MKQQVNLYQPIFRKQKVVFSAHTMLWVSTGFLLLLIAWSLLVEWRVSSLESGLQRQLRVEEQAIQRLAQLRDAMPSTEPDPRLQHEVEDLQQWQQALRESLAVLQSRAPEQRVRLRPRLEALARRHPEGLWLTGVELADDGRHLRLEGRALSARLVPAYLEALALEPVIEGLRFRQVRVQTADDGKPGVAFLVSTQPGDEP